MGVTERHGEQPSILLSAPQSLAKADGGNLGGTSEPQPPPLHMGRLSLPWA